MLPRYSDKCVCHTCGEYFNSSGAFARHRTGTYAPIGKANTRTCLTVGEMEAKGWIKSKTGHWMRGKRSDSTVAQRRGDEIGTDGRGTQG